MLDMVVGEQYGYREHAHTYGDPISRVDAVKLGPSKSRPVKVLWVDSENEGLEKWIPRIRLIVPWDKVEAFLHDKRRLLAAWGASGEVRETNEWEAVEEVLFALPDDAGTYLCWSAGGELLEMENLESGAAALDMDPQELLAEPRAYVDRFGHYFAPFPVARRAAQITCQHYTRDVLEPVMNHSLGGVNSWHGTKTQTLPE